MDSITDADVLARRFAYGPEPNARELVWFEIAAEPNLPAQISTALAVYYRLRERGPAVAEQFRAMCANPAPATKRG